ncbi:MAG: DUF3524 domain-containing protein [Desulfobacter sp.]|nr:MAG: DUF3524 domain-containing protein [Desulfobacter sp.]
MKILYLESFYGGSHRDVADGFAEYSSHEVEILSLPPRFWKWRMRGAALEFIRRIENISAYDLIFATDMVDLTDFKALAGPGCPPIVLYFHENQLTYPLAPGERRDFHLGFTNMVSALAADRVLFNSRFHMDDFFTAARRLVRKMPDARPSWMLDAIGEKSGVLYPGCRLPLRASQVGANDTVPPLVVWNHRWEYDKNPDGFFRALRHIKSRGTAFSLAVLGEQYDNAPPVFDRAKEEFRSELRAFGFQASRRDYLSWLSRGTVAVSTADQENFGISIMEAVAHGCFPLLPDRLSYPELIPEDCRDDVIYESESGLEDRLSRILQHPAGVLPARNRLAEHAASFSWEAMIGGYDDMLEDVAGRKCL